MSPRKRKKHCLQIETLEGRIALATATGSVAPPMLVQAAASVSHPTIKLHSTGPAVRELQRDLKTLGYDIGTTGRNHDGIDGDFGTKTQGAVKKFQREHFEIDSHGQPDRRHPLKVDGIVGPKTWASLDEAVSRFLCQRHGRC
jgi:peptidoglycan hydrolase-like protein with peptidoglycan-binding domain